MHITQITVYQLPVKLKEPFVISLGPLTHAENIVVKIDCDEGLTGFGECSPFRTIHGESMHTGYVVAADLAKAIIGLNPLAIEDAIMKMDSIIYGNNCIKSAFDMALYDIASQHAGLPLYAFLGGSISKELYTDYTVSFNAIDKMVHDAIAIKERGFKFIKVKLGGTKEMDIARVNAIRNAIGDEIPLRIDANQGWQTDEAIEILDAIKDLGIQYCEEPIARWNYMELTRIRQQSAIKIMADESCCDPHDAARLIKLGAADMFNIKLSKAGGIFKAQQIIRLAADAGISLQIGGFLESRLGFTAAAHLAHTGDHIQHYDFDTPLMFEEDHVSGGIIYGDEGHIKLPGTPGLGATIDATTLMACPHRAHAPC